MQLVAYGAQDVYLTGDPQITYFKVVYRRHTNFAMECIEQTFNGTAGAGKKVSCTISRNGDLIGAMHLEVPLSAGPTSLMTNASYIKDVEVEIGGQKIDKHYGEWLDIWMDLAIPNDKIGGPRLGESASMLTAEVLLATTGGDVTVTSTVTTVVSIACTGGSGSGLVIGATPSSAAAGATVTFSVLSPGSGYQTGDIIDITQAQLDAGVGFSAANKAVAITLLDADFGAPAVGPASGMYTMLGNNATAARSAFVPLQFWFNRNVGLALPLIALQYHEVKLNVTFGAAATATSKLWVDYIYLDTEERKRFAQMSHEYLIDQLQFPGSETMSGTTSKARLNFNHPVKELLWVTGTSTTNRIQGCSTAKLMLNGHDRFASRVGEYFSEVQPFYHHTKAAPKADVYVYSFSLRPEEHQPSGTCNFSRIDNATLTLSVKNSATSLRVYAINYNVLRVVSGMGGLAYSN